MKTETIMDNILLKDKIKKSYVLEKIVQDYYEEFENNVQTLLRMLEKDKLDDIHSRYVANVMYNIFEYSTKAIWYDSPLITTNKNISIVEIHGLTEIKKISVNTYTANVEDDFSIIGTKDNKTLKYIDIYIYNAYKNQCPEYKWLKVKLNE